MQALSDVVQFAGGYNNVGLLVDGVPQGTGVPITIRGAVTELQFSGWGAGTHTIELVDGPCGVDVSGVPPVRYTPILGFRLPGGSSLTTISPSAPAKRIVVLGDSLTQGAFASSGANQAGVYQAWPVLMRANALASGAGAFAGARVIVAGSGGRGWVDEASTAPLITASVARLTAQLNGSSSNLLIVDLGTNDFSLGSAAATIATWAGDWVDAVHAALTPVKVVFITPTTRASEATPNAGGSTLAQIRTAIAGVVSARSSYCTLIAGPALVTYPTNMAADNLHYNTAGMIEKEANIRAALNSASLGY